MKAWRTINNHPPADDELQLVKTYDDITALARYYDDMWIDEYTNRIIQVEFWMPIPITPAE